MRKSICTLFQILLGYKIKEGGISGTCNMLRGDDRWMYAKLHLEYSAE
jgi:hypothetical protein